LHLVGIVFPLPESVKFEKFFLTCRAFGSPECLRLGHGAKRGLSQFLQA
jgi:hypothetical protein